MKFFNVVLVAALAAFANAAAVPNTEAALDTNPLEKRCKATGTGCNAATDCCNGACISTTANKFAKHCN